ncbi:hypothetical protein CHS0354_040943 [Potamilus streckersoni]|uniref:E3 ubiquitin-protein ligase APD1-4 middle domain-containing protein n=1 Tax=Potamilus streckersoni TaxID=2493646 RepID=A0AAE0W9N1_9BIVA|nr:hypothetical protein CHS0354_040943 [Potamilus streckersoni]
MMLAWDYVPSDSDGSTVNSSFHCLQDSERTCTGDEYHRCSLISTFLKNIMCPGKIKRKARVAILWVCLTTVFLPMALIIRFGKYADQSVTASSHDMRTVDGISTVFCEKITIKSSKFIDVYLFPTYPDISPQLQSSYMTQNTSIGVNKYEYWEFYLIKGSKGKDMLKEWESDTSCTTCYMYYTNIYNKCEFFESDDYLLNILETNEYYFVFSNEVKSTVTLQVNFQLNRAMYNITYSINQCLSTSSCTFILKSLSSMVAAFYVEGMDQKDVIVTYSCEARLWLYISAFFLIPTFFGLSASLTLICCCRTKTNPSSQQQRIWNTSQSFNSVGQINQIYTDPPPTYEDVICGRV